MRLDGVRLYVSDPAAAVAAYERLLGVPAAPAGEGCWRLQLARGAVEIAEGGPARLAVTFATEDGDDLTAWPTDTAEHGGIEVLVLARVAADVATAAPSAVQAIDHVVVHTMDPERAIAHWRDRLGLRLALDRGFPERKLRLVFFRSGGITLEYAHALEEGEGEGGTGDAVYGVSYRVADIEDARRRLLDAGLEVSEVRDGVNPGSRVATVRSGTAGVPTLLIEPPPRE